MDAVGVCLPLCPAGAPGAGVDAFATGGRGVESGVGVLEPGFAVGAGVLGGGVLGGGVLGGGGLGGGGLGGGAPPGTLLPKVAVH